MRIVARHVPLVMVVILLGCRVHVEPPKPSTISEIRGRLLARVDAMIRQIEQSGGFTPHRAQQLSADLTTFIGHLRTTGVATDEQLYQLEQAQYALSQGKGVRPLPPKDWRPDEGQPLPEVRVPAGPFKEILPRLRKLIAEIPDSDRQAIVD